jgi:hypothetical protein
VAAFEVDEEGEVAAVDGWRTEEADEEEEVERLWGGAAAGLRWEEDVEGTGEGEDRGEDLRALPALWPEFVRCR